MNLPNFLCLGVQKAGTTLLFDILKQHPDIYLPDSKELHFFDRDDRYENGVLWYQENYFSGSENYQCIGEITPSYLFFDSVPERIQKTLGSNIKLIILLRNPVDRAYSHYWMQFKRGIETLPFMEALIMEPARIRQGYFGKTRFSYINRGFYSEQIERYLNYFPLENMKFIIFEEFIRDISGKINEILSFINCDHLHDLKAWKKINASELEPKQYIKGLVLNRRYISKKNLFGSTQDYPSLKPEYRQTLAKIFRDEISRLESLINKDLSVWYRRNT